MKKYIFSLTVLLCFFSLQAQQVWTEISSGTSHDLYDVYFPTVNTGYAVGGYYGESKAIILKTVDGGQNWSIIDSLNSPLFTKVYFFNENNGLTFTEYPWNDNVAQPFVYITSDGGNTWQNIIIPNLDWIHDIVETDGTLFLTGGKDVENFRSQLYISTDMGASWSLVHQAENPHLIQISFINEQLGYGYASDTGTYKTTNGGVNWIQIHNQPFGDFVIDFVFGDNLTGFAGGTFYVHGLLRTIDGGVNWTPLTFVPFSNFIRIYDNAVYAGGAQFMGSQKKIVLSFDMGNTLTELETPNNGAISINDIYLIDETYGIAVGNNGKIYKMDTSSLASMESMELEKKIKIYPNPAKNILNIEIVEQTSIQKICLINVQGRLIREYPANIRQLDVSGIVPENYFLEIYTEHEKITKKVVIK